MKKVVYKLGVNDGKVKKKVMKKISGLAGVDSVSMDAEMKLTVTGDIDPVSIAKMLRDYRPEIVSVGPAKEPEKKDDEGKEEDDKTKKLEAIAPYGLHGAGENPNPNACVIF